MVMVLGTSRGLLQVTVQSEGQNLPNIELPAEAEAEAESMMAYRGVNS